MAELPTIIFAPYPLGGRPPEYFSQPPQPPASPPVADQDERARHQGLQRVIKGDAWTQAILQVVPAEREAVRITTLVNQVARLDAHATWKEFEDRKLMLFRLVGLLIKQGRLDRVSRRYVTVPRDDAKWEAYLASLRQPLDLPPPRI